MVYIRGILITIYDYECEITRETCICIVYAIKYKS